MRVLVVHPGPHFSVADVHRGLVAGLRANGADVVDLNLHDRLGFYSSAGRMIEDSGEWIRLVDDEGAVRLASKGIEAACYEFQPDAVVIISCFYVPLDLLDLIRARGSKVVIVHTEEPYEHDRQMVRAAHADLNLINDPTNLDAYAALGQALYMPHAYDPAIHCPGPAVPDAVSEDRKSVV